MVLSHLLLLLLSLLVPCCATASSAGAGAAGGSTGAGGQPPAAAVTDPRYVPAFHQRPPCYNGLGPKHVGDGQSPHDIAGALYLPETKTWHVMAGCWQYPLGGWRTNNPGLQGTLMEELLALATAAKLHPREPQAYPLADAARALDDVNQRRVVGKVVLQP